MTAPEISLNIDTQEVIPKDGFNEYPVHFDYLDNDDGFTIQIIHDGKSDKDIKFLGKLPGVSGFKTTIIGSRPNAILKNLRSDVRSVYTPPVIKWLVMPLACLALGGLGIWSIYWAIFRQFHWYQVFGFICVIYLLVPFVLISEPSPPRKLCDELMSADDHDA